TVLVAVVLDLSRARGEATLSVLVEAAHAIERVLVRPILGCELVDLVERRPGRSQARSDLLLVLAAIACDSDAADQRRQGQPLDHERGEDDREGQEDDQVAVWKRRVGV